MQVRTLVTVAAATIAAATTPAMAQSRSEDDRRSILRPVRGPRPELGFDVQVGVNGYTGGLGAATHVGPMWQARVGLHLWEWFSIGAAYTAGYNAGRREVVGAGVGVLNNGGYVSASVIVPFRAPVRPYAGIGLGYGWTSVVGANARNTPLQSNAGAFVPMGAGFDVELAEHWSVGPQFVYQLGIGGSGGDGSELSDGDNWSCGVSLGYSL